MATEYCENMTRRPDFTDPCHGECRMHLANDSAITHCADCGEVLELVVQDDFDFEALFVEAAVSGMMITWPLITRCDVEVSS